jgi:hypothetical protein
MSFVTFSVCDRKEYHKFESMKWLLPLYLIILACNQQPKQEKQDQEQPSPEWIQLFNGKDLKDWNVKINGYRLNDNFANTFRVENGVMKVVYDGYDQFGKKYGHIFYKDKYSYYLLGIEYRFVNEQASGGEGWAIRNSGAMLHCQDPRTIGLNQDFPISIEAQLLGGNGKDKRTTANLCSPGTNVVMNGKLFTDHCVNSNSDTYHADRWVRVDILVLGDSIIKHYVEKQLVLQYEKPQIGGGNVSNFDPSVKKDGMLLKEGYISLQSESHPIEFRKVELLNLQGVSGDKEKLEQLLKGYNIK